MDFSNYYRKIGMNIKLLRNKAGLTQEELAEKANISVDYLGKIEKNINNPGLQSLIKLKIALNTNLTEIFKDLQQIFLKLDNIG